VCAAIVTTYCSNVYLYSTAVSVDSVLVTGSAADNTSVGPTMLSTSSETSRPYVDAMMELNPLDGSCSARIVVHVQSMRIVFDAVSFHSSILHLFSFSTANFNELLVKSIVKDVKLAFILLYGGKYSNSTPCLKMCKIIFVRTSPDFQQL